MSAEAASAVASHPRQLLSGRQQRTVAALIDAGLEELRDEGYEQLTVRSVATRAGVTHTTAYTYFSSKAHLVAEIYWRRLQSIPEPATRPDQDLAERVRASLAGPALILADEPALAHAALSAMLTTDVEVERLRNQIGADLADRISRGAGPEVDPRVVDALLLAFSGAMLQAGMGYFGFSEVVDRMAAIAKLVSPRA